MRHLPRVALWEGRKMRNDSNLAQCFQIIVGAAIGNFCCQLDLRVFWTHHFLLVGIVWICLDPLNYVPRTCCTPHFCWSGIFTVWLRWHTNLCTPPHIYILIATKKPSFVSHAAYVSIAMSFIETANHFFKQNVKLHEI